MIKSEILEMEFIEKKNEAKDAYTFYFKRPKNFNFFSGQYIKIFLDIKNSDDRGTSRYFTISSSPTEKAYIAITTRIIKSSFKLSLDRIIPGQKIKAFGPIGYFDFNPKENNDIVLISGGIGITPFHSLINFINDKNLKTNILLMASFDFKENIIFFDELKKIESKNKLIRIIYSLSKEKTPGVNFERGRIDEKLIKKYVLNFTFSKFYISGPQLMVENMYVLIKNLGISEERIFKEDFPGY